MNKVVLPGVTFLAGLVCGMLFLSRDDNTQSMASGAGGISPEFSDSRLKDRHRTGMGGGSDSGADLADLLDLHRAANPTGSLLALAQRIAGLDVADLRQLLLQIETTPNPHSDDWQREVYRTALLRYAEIDPDGALGFAQGKARGHNRPEALAAVFAQLATEDPGKVLAAARDLEDPEEAQQAVDTLAKAYRDGLPEKLLQIVEDRDDVTLSGAFKDLFADWARDDPRSAIAKLEGIPPGRSRNFVLDGIASGLLQRYPERCLEWAEGLTKAQERDRVVNTMVRALAATDPKRALEVLESHGGVTQRSRLLESLASRWAYLDLPAAQAWIESLSGNEQVMALRGGIFHLGSDPEWTAARIAELPASAQTGSLTRSLAEAWTRDDPGAAAEWIRTLPEGDSRRNARSALIENWLKKDLRAAATYLEGESLGDEDGAMVGRFAGKLITVDPEAAFSWMNKLALSDRARSRMIASAVDDWADHDVAAAADYVLQLDKWANAENGTLLDGMARDNALSGVMAAWGEQDLEGAEAWAVQLEDPKARQSALTYLVTNTADQAPARAAAIFDKILGVHDETAREDLERAAETVGFHWAKAAPGPAAEWALDLPESIDRGGVLHRVVSNWASAAPADAAEWVGQLEAGAARDGAVAGLVGKLETKDPGSAFRWAVTIDDRETRERTAYRTVSFWNNSDPAAARAAVEASDLSDELKQRSLELLDD